MTEQEREDRLNEALDAAGEEPKSTGDAELDGLVRMAAKLRGIPDPDFRERLRGELSPAPGRGLLPALLARVRRAGATPTGRLAIAVPAAVAGAAAVVIILFLAGVLSGGGGPSHVAVPVDTAFEMTATKGDAIGVDLDTTFVVASRRDLPVETVRGILRVEPQVALDVKKEGIGEYLVSAKQRLEPGTVYRFVLEQDDDNVEHVLASFAFQTKTPIGVVQTLPRDQATSVPLNTGIEMTFTEEGVQDIEGHFHIDPPVTGRFEVHKRVIVFVPQGGLAPAQLYTVTVTAGLTVAGSDEVMANDFVFRFETSDTARSGEVPRVPVLNFTRKVVETALDEPAALELYTSETGDVSISVDVYRIDRVDGFVASIDAYQQIPTWAEVTRSSYLTDTSGLERVAAFDADVQHVGDFGKQYIQFPDTLPEGYYVVQSSFHDRPIQAWLQVTDVATYAALGETGTLVWVNDLSTQQPIQGARVEYLNTDASGETRADGTVTIDTPDGVVQRQDNGYGYYTTQTDGTLLVTAPDGRQAVVPMGSIAQAGYGSGYYARTYVSAGDDYWTYLSTERPLYLPTDTIHFWGIARPRENPGSRTVTVQLEGRSFFDFNYRPVVVAKTQVQTNALGTLTGDLPISGLSPDYYTLTTYVDGQQLSSIGVQVKTYTKPAYKIDVVPNKLAVFAGDEVTYAITASFLEGSPVPGLRLRYSGDTTGELVTDGEGHASVTVEAGKGKYGGSDYSSLSVTPVLAEEGEIIGEAWVAVYPSALAITADTDVQDGKGVISGTVHHLDLSKVNDKEAPDADVMGEPARNVTVSFSIDGVSYRQVEIGEYYDFIAKIVRKRYRYDEVRNSLGTFTVTTDADGAFRYTFPIDQDKYYEVSASVTDSESRIQTLQLYVSGAQSKFNYGSDYVYLRRSGSQANIFGASSGFALGDDVALQMYRGGDALPSGKGNRYLFVKAQRGVHGYTIRDDATLRFTFSEEDVPNVTVLGVWFNGRTYVETNFGYDLRFEPSARKLNIAVTPDKDRYEPGDDVHIDFVVTDQQGRPARGTEINASVVDEAIFLIQGPYAYSQDVLQSVYQSVGPGILKTYASHQYPSDLQSAERGGDGGPRLDFADVAFYGTVTTDDSGHAAISFTLPDNLTSWRVTAQAFNDRIQAGAAQHQLPVGLPFFADVTLSDEYLVTDQPVLRVRSFGRALHPGDDVTFSVNAPSLGLGQAVEVSAPAFQAARVSLPALTEGTHEILIEARSGSLTDSLVRTIRVVPSRLVSAQTHFYDLSSSLHIEGSSSGPTKVVFSDHERGRYYPLLQQLTWDYGDRVDQQVARSVAAGLLNSYYEDVEVTSPPFDPAIYQTSDGGIGLFPYAGADLTLSARLASVAPDRFGRTTLSNYFLTILRNENETRERQVIALYGLASLGEPVLVALQRLDKTDLTWRERLYAGLALAELGDDTDARAIYQRLIDDFGESRSPGERLLVGTDQDDILEATSLAAILAASLGDARASQLFDYAQANYTSDILIELEQISYVAKVLPRLSSAPVRFAYTLDGQRTEVELSHGQTRTIQVTSDQLAGLRFEPIEGEVGVASFYTAPIDRPAITVDPAVTVTRTYDKDPTTLKEGDLVQIKLQVTFGPRALDGCYQLSDLLPSGLRAVSSPYAFNVGQTYGYPYQIEGQRVSFCVSKNQIFNGAVYYARVVSPGRYTAEPAVIQSMQSAESINFSAPGKVVIE